MFMKSSIGVSLLLLVITGLAKAECPDEGPPRSTEPSLAEVERAITGLACYVEGIAAELEQEHEVIPSRFYHFGKKKYLLEDIHARTIPPKVWDEFFMGDKTRFKLGASRRGLYGTAGVDGNGFGGGEFNWLMEIRIKKACLKANRFLTLMDLPRNPRFSKWYSDNQKKIAIPWDQFAGRCYTQSSPKGDIEGFSDGACDAIVNDFMNQNRIAVVQDHRVSKSFYIRDRACIETILGTPNEWLTLLGIERYLWRARCGVLGANLIPGLVLQSLAEKTGPLRPEVIPRLRARIREGNFAIRRLYDPETVRAALDAAERCDRMGRTREFRHALKGWIGDSLEIPRDLSRELDRLCLTSTGL